MEMDDEIERKKQRPSSQLRLAMAMPVYTFYHQLYIDFRVALVLII